MLTNYLKTALRNLMRNRFFSFINIFGLAVAMSICMVLIMLVADQMSYDRHNTNGARLYRVNTIGVDDKGVVIEQQENSSSPMTVGPELLEQYTGVEKAVRFRRGFGNGWLELENQNVNIPLAGFFADAAALEVFQYELEFGDAATALVEPYSVVLTRQAANKLFKEHNPTGLTLKVDDLGNYTVTGVLKETSNKSHIVFEGLASMSTVKSLELAGKLEQVSDNWTNYWNGWTYILAERGRSEADLTATLDAMYEKHIGSLSTPGVYKMKFLLQPLYDITPGHLMNNPIGPQLPWVFVYFLAGLASVILLTSCFNFTNLSIARSLTRAREIGVRKATGAARWQIFGQFISESIVITAFALAVALLLVALLEPLVLQLNFARIFRWELTANSVVYAIFGLFALVVAVLAGFFPAVVMSGFQPVQVLKNLGTMKLFSRMGLRKTLLVSQFTLSLFFILTVLIAHKQLHLFTHQDHGFNMNNNIAVKLNHTSAANLKTELQKHANITSVTAASHVPAAGTSYGNGFKRAMSDPDFFNVEYFLVDEDYAANMNLRMAAGTFFKAENGNSNKNMVVVNEAALRAFRFASAQEAIGQTVVHQADTTEKIVIGVVADYNHRDLTRPIDAMALMYDTSAYQLLQVAYVGTFAEAGKAIEQAWATVNPGKKIDYAEVKSEVNKFYEIVFGDLVNVLSFVSMLAILLSCLGLLGMATYATETRMKEISIRKILGSSDSALVLLLSKGFLSILGLSIAIGTPLAFFANNLWLELIAYHTTMGIGTIAGGILVLLFFGFLTIGSQTWRAVFVKPVDNLKSE
jgi:putative ABC transport system permease protein